MQAMLAMANETITEQGQAREPAQAQPTEEQARPEAGEREEERGERAPRGMVRFARRHPALTLIGAAGVSLLGGIEVAAGVLLGAGVVAMLRPKRREIEAEARGEPQAHAEHAEHEMREVLSEARQRVRAVAQAARGELHPR